MSMNEDMLDYLSSIDQQISRIYLKLEEMTNVVKGMRSDDGLLGSEKTAVTAAGKASSTKTGTLKAWRSLVVRRDRT